MHRNKRKTKRHINKHHSVHNQNEKQQYKLIRPPILNLLHVVLGCEFETIDVEKLKERKKIIRVFCTNKFQDPRRTV